MLLIREKEKEQRINQIKRREIIKLFSNDDVSIIHSKYSKMSDSRLIQNNKQNYYKPKLYSANQSRRNRKNKSPVGRKQKQKGIDRLSSVINEVQSNLVSDKSVLKNRSEEHDNKQNDE